MECPYKENHKTIERTNGKAYSCPISACPYDYNKGTQLVEGIEIKNYCFTNGQITEKDSKRFTQTLDGLLKKLEQTNSKL